MFTLLAVGTVWRSAYLMPISLLIVGGLLFLVTFSYRQTIRAYPQGGGELHRRPRQPGHHPRPRRGCGAAHRLRPHGVGQCRGGRRCHTSASWGVRDVRVELAAVRIVVVMLVNLRGVRESGAVFAMPTYVFMGSMLVLIGVGFARRDRRAPVVTDVVRRRPGADLGVLLLMRAFADGCTAMTGVKAESNGVPAFKRPES